jgi:hypothetical protein
MHPAWKGVRTLCSTAAEAVGLMWACLFTFSVRRGSPKLAVNIFTDSSAAALLADNRRAYRHMGEIAEALPTIWQML